MLNEIKHRMTRRDFLRLCKEGPKVVAFMKVVEPLLVGIKIAGVVTAGTLAAGCELVPASQRPGKKLDSYLNVNEGDKKPEVSDDLPCGPQFHCTYGELERYTDDTGTMIQLLTITGETHTNADRLAIYKALDYGDDGTGTSGFLSSKGVTIDNFSLEDGNVILAVHSSNTGVLCVRWQDKDGQIFQMSLNELSSHLQGSPSNSSQTGPGALMP